MLEGEPGIGKSRLLAWAAEAAGAEVLSARASEYEADLPYGLWIDALGDELVVSGDRHRTHGALRARLEARARRSWSASTTSTGPTRPRVDALAALVHRPPAGDVLLVLAARTGQLPRALGAVAPIRIGPLSEDEARELVGADADAVYGASGGNPFYLEQLVAVRRRGGGGGERRRHGPARGRRGAGGGARRARRGRAAAARRGGGGGRPVRARPGGGGGRARRRAAPRSTSSSPARWSAPAAPRGASRSATRSSATRSTRRRPGAGGSARTLARRPRSSVAGPGRSSARTTSSRPPRPATRRRSRC